MITKFEQFLLEAISLSQAKLYTKIWKDSGMENYLNAEFKGKYRIYIPLKDVKMSKVYQDLKRDVETVLSQGGYETINYYENQCKKITDKNITKITKTLTKLKRDDLTLQYNAHLQQFDAIANSGKSNELTVVISRHPIDIAGMSTGRAWRSCMSLDDGVNKQYVEQDVRAGTIIAYLIKPEDTNIENPLSRILMKPFVNKETNKSYLIPEKVYGEKNDEFYNTVEEWLKDLQGDLPDGLYNLHSNLYADSKKTKIISSSGNVGKIHELIANDSLVYVQTVTDDYIVTELARNDVFEVVFNSGSNKLFFDIINLSLSGDFYLKNLKSITKQQSDFVGRAYKIRPSEDFESFRNMPRRILGDFYVNCLYPIVLDFSNACEYVRNDFKVFGTKTKLLNLANLANRVAGDVLIYECVLESFEDLYSLKKPIQFIDCKFLSIDGLDKIKTTLQISRGCIFVGNPDLTPFEKSGVISYV